MFYGLIDIIICYSMYENVVGNYNLQMMDGVLIGSCWGLCGIEDLGGGIKVMFIFEFGFLLDIGNSQQGGCLFGCIVVVGLEGDYGKFYFGC